ncbi:la-related protein 1C-like isoform X1 [Neltuma alba]|uniref:la-related protein 1C-like isoform X1 n=1 Tax=Neltuma alba TaxID=207710 RepID=UPI0010A2F185|nr:la-related protein 1C-like isoform X1 [Prosopis alba]
MVTATDSSSDHRSPTSAGDTNSPKFPRKNLPSPWAQVVRGGECESHPSPPSSSSSSSSLTASVPDQPPFSDFPPKEAPLTQLPDNSNVAAVDNSDASDANAGHSKRPAWSKPSNGVVEAGPVMGAVTWPALSKSTKVSSKMSADSSSKTAFDGSLSPSQGSGTLQSPQKQPTNNAKPNSATNYAVHHRQRSMKRGGSNSPGVGHAQSSFSNPPPPPPPPPFPVFPIPVSTYGNVVPGVSDHSPREIPYRNNSWDTRPPVGGFVPAVNDHWNPPRRGNFGPHQRGDGSYHNNHGGRRDHDRGNHANSRDAQVHQQRMSPRGLVRHPPPNTPAFVAPPPMGPFANPMGFPEFYYFPTLPLEPFRGMPFITHGPPPAMFLPVAEPPLTNMLMNQIDYYFSDANLVKDDFLRSNMDEQGWVPIALIANFRRVKSLTNNIQVILDSLRNSAVVEVQGDKMRRRNEWMKWLPSSQLRADSGSSSPVGSSCNNVATDFQKIALGEAATDRGNSDPTSEALEERSPTDSSCHPLLPTDDTSGNTN